MSIRIYNTLTREKQEFKPIKKASVGMYVCGPTVYDDPHIGHARSAYVFDVIRRYFVYKGYKVRFASNVTDVDDKIINKAREGSKGEDLNSAVKKISDRYLKSYHRYMDALGIKRPDVEPKATRYIEKMKDFITLLIQRGMAYSSEGDVYFNVKKAKDYGKLSNQSFEMLESGARISPEENKRDPLDFALWKKAKEGEPSWSSPWGSGRPGWHIECSVMALDILGDEFDIHGGGIDLIFPHHENEIAQSEGAGKKFARYWIHNGLLTINKEKMAKSLGNFVTIDEVLSRYSVDVLKILFLQTHYSHPVDFSWERMEEKERALHKITDFLKEVKEIKKSKKVGFKLTIQDINKRLASKDFIKEIKRLQSRFKRAMDEDFNTPFALACLFQIVELCTHIWNYDTYKKEKHLSILILAEKSILELGGILGLTFKQKKKKWPIPKKEIDKKIVLRNKARQGKDFKTADKIRKDLDEIGIILEDEKGGETTLHLK